MVVDSKQEIVTSDRLVIRESVGLSQRGSDNNLSSIARLNISIAFLMELKRINIHELSHTTFKIQVVMENPYGIRFLM